MSNSPIVLIDREPGKEDSEPRFAFGKNWRRFLQYLDPQRIEQAEKSLRDMLEIDNLNGQSFLDIGCGSGLFSLAAMRLGAARVHSFDYDPQCVACTQELQRRYFQGAENWTIGEGDVLDMDYLSTLGQFDVVYSWGVLHHTGKMWQALENVVGLLRPKGRLFIALYNDQDLYSRLWKVVKRNYSRRPVLRLPIIAVFWLYFMVRDFFVDLLILRRNPLDRYRQFKRSRGMSYFTDLVDWLGGYPYEVARPDAVFDFYRRKGFELQRLKTVGGRLGNNQYVFLKPAK